MITFFKRSRKNTATIEILNQDSVSRISVNFKVFVDDLYEIKNIYFKKIPDLTNIFFDEKLKDSIFVDKDVFDCKSFNEHLRCKITFGFDSLFI